MKKISNQINNLVTEYIPSGVPLVHELVLSDIQTIVQLVEKLELRSQQIFHEG